MKKLLTLALALVALAAFASIGIAQEQKEAVPTQEALPRPLPCPIPWQFTLTAPPPVTATPYLPDFPAKCSAGWEPNFNGTTKDRCFRHTFRWRKPYPCCQYIKGTLTITYKALQAGAIGSATSFNDEVTIYKTIIPLLTQRLYPQNAAVTLGQPGTTVVQLTPAMLAGERLSFLIQDDTSVKLATLEVVGCCVKP